MLRDMRAKTKGILWFVVVAFVGSIGLIWGADLLGPGGGGQTRDPAIVGCVNGENIYGHIYSRAIEQAFVNYEAERGQRPSTEEETDKVREDAWNGLIADILIAGEIQKRKIKVLDEEVLMQVKNNPPPQIRRMEVFSTDGQFDHAKYLAALQDPRYDWLSLEYHARSQIPRIKLEGEIISSVRVTDAEVREAFARQNEKVKVTYAYLGPSDYLKEEILSTEEDLLAYYDENQEDYRLPDQATLRWVAWPKGASPEDEAVILELLDEIYADLDKGEDFAKLAEIYSDDPGSAENGGDLGFFGRGAMVKEFEDTAFALEVGQVSEPVKTRFGYHIIKLEEKKGDEVRARHILLELEASRRTIEELWFRSAAFDSLASEMGFTEAAEEQELEVTETKPFSQGSYIPGVGRSTRASRMTFDGPVGDIIGPFDLQDNFVVMEIASRVPSHIQPFADIEDRVKRSFETARRLDMARAAIHEIAAKIAGGKTLEQATPSGSIRHGGPFSETTAAGGITGDPRFIGTAFVLPEGQISDVIETRTGFVILRVDEKVPFDEDEYAKTGDQLRDRLLMQKQQAAFSIWFNGIYEASKIEDYRDKPIT
ncbi:MAG: peptidylprolyl isomerase [Candidatus Eisenbacteria sp.]|nr:peptidylprolyl isomerase [Candidatus Eisenbacteria bacterium]